MSPESLEAALTGAQETDSIEFKSAISWEARIFVKDILAMANVIDGGVIVVGVEDDNCKRQGVTAAQIASYNYDLMRDQIDPYADPRVVFSRQILKDSAGLSYVIIEVAPFEEMPVICARDGHDVDAGAIYFRSRSRRPASARISRVEDMREIIEASISRRFRNLRRAGFVPAAEGRHALDEELGDL